MKNHSIIKNFAIIGFGTFLNMLLGFFTTPIITRIVDPSSYGQFSIFTLYSNIALMVLSLGFDQAFVRYFYDNSTARYKHILLIRCVTLPIIITIVSDCILCICVLLNMVKFEFDLYYTNLLCIYTLLLVISRFSLLVVRLEYDSKLYSFLNVIQKIVYILVAIPLLIWKVDDYLNILILATIVATAVCDIIGICSKKNVWFKTKNNKDSIIDCVSRKEIFVYSYPFIFSLGMTTFFHAIDKLSLNYFHSYYEVGIYSSAMSLVNIVSIIQITFNSLWSPLSIENYTKNQNDKSFYIKGNQIITVIMFFAGFSLIAGKDFFSILLGEKYRESAYILPFLIFSPIMYTISETTVCGIVFKKKSSYHVAIAITACIVNLTCNTILVPILAGRGAAISTGLSYIVFFSMRTILSNKLFYVDYKLKKFYFITVVSTCYAIYNTFFGFSIFNLIFYLLCCSTLFFLYKDVLFEIANYLMEYGMEFLNKS